MRAHAVLTAVLVLASQTGDASCQNTDIPRSRVCWVDTRGIRVEGHGAYVVDVITTKCSVRPLEHRLEAWLEYKRSVWGEWTMPRFPANKFGIPDEKGISARVELRCKQGYYRAAWRVSGRGPEVPGYPNGIPFDEHDGDFGSTPVSAEECSGS